MTAQIQDIKKESKDNSSRSSNSEWGGSGEISISGFFDGIGYLLDWQEEVLRKRKEIVGIVGLDVMVHSIVQHSNYYIFNPRIRGNWGIFSSDFRVNYLLEETINGNDDLLTYDWQIIQLNFINTKNAIVRIGTGILQETFGGKQSFLEWGASTNLMFKENKMGGFAEFRSARDYETGVFPRREISLQLHHQLFQAGILHGFTSAGFQFQRYYNKINAWGIQLGLVFRFY